jgi:hypothetical protein
MRKMHVMFKLSAKSFWAGGVIVLAALAMVVKLALAITAFTPGGQPTGYIAQDEITSYNLRSGTETLYRSDYEKEFFSGNLFAYPVDANGNVNTASEWWSGGAQVHIDAQNFDTGRLIATMRDNGSPIAFRWDSLSATQQGYLTSSTILNYLRGDRSNEIPNASATLRQRKSALGDIVHTRPYYVADTINPTIFVGANDGMLHAINAKTDGGEERWAYVPSMLLNKMKNLSANPYVRDYFVDGQINIANITSSGSKRVLVGGLGGGGKGLYALDITGSAGLIAGSEATVASKVLWEITPTKVNYANPLTANAYVNLGYTYGTSTIAKVSGADTVIIGNGYNDNSGGDYQAYLFLINPYTGQRISAIQAGTSGTAASPNGLSTPVAVDSNGDGSIDLVYAGDLNGTMWKFDLATSTASALLTTSPAQPITSTPGVALHPNGGYMVNFVTGAMFTSADASNTAIHYAYGIWDGAPVANSVMLSQTLTERSYTAGSSTLRVRRVTSNLPVWTSGAGNHKGWKVALPAGERVVGDGSFIENGRFYFTGYNPTISNTIPNTTTVVYGSNWLMELDYLSGGSKNQPFLDLNGDVKLDNTDRLKYITGDTIPTGSAVGDPIQTTDGIPVGKYLSVGVLSQPILVQLASLNDTLFNQNPDIVTPAVVLPETGVTGGHFDVDIFYGAAAGGTGATATITVASTGRTNPATLGGISLDGVTIVPALTTGDISNGTATTTNATTIKNKVTGGFSATVSGSTVTITAPPGADYNGKTMTIIAGTSGSGSAAVAGVRPTGLISFSGTTTSSSNSAVINDDLSNSRSVRVGGSSAYSSAITIGKSKSPTQAASAVVSAIGTSGNYAFYIGGNSITPTCASRPVTVVCVVDTTTYDNARDITIGSTSNFGGLTVSLTATSGGVTPVSAITAWDNFAPALSTAAFSGGADGTVGDTCTQCSTKSHTHQYDDKFDVTGVDMLNPSETKLRLSNAIPSTTTNFKVIAHNQYLSPAAKLHIGNSNYLYNVDAGYIRMKDFVTSTTLDLSTLPTYNRSTIGSLVFNFPVDGLTSKDWWGTGDVRSGLHPAGNYLCPISSATQSNDGNMFRPIVPPANGVNGPGAQGWTGSTTPATATGARHNGALTIQVIKANTPNASIEQNVSGRPEYGWRVKSADYAKYVLVEYVTFWHTPDLRTSPPSQNTGPCYGDTGWTKAPAQDPSSSAAATKAAGSTDPKIGDLSAGGNGTVTSTVTTVAGNVTTTVITYSNGSTARIVRTANSDGSVTIVTTDAAGVVTTQIVAATGGSVKSGGDERGLQAKTGRISWHELVSP